MRYLFTPAMEKKLSDFLCPGTLLTFDFDGTLAPIVAKPDDAALGKSTAAILEHLCQLAPVAVVSGRGARDVCERVPFRLVACVGNHGMEGIPAHREKARAAAAAVKAWRKTLKQELAGEAGLLIEDKKYSLTVHYRASRRRAEAEERVLSVAKALRPAAEIQPGKCVVNIMMKGAYHKGHAIRELLKNGKYRRAIFVGDDITDEDVFRLQDPRIFSIRVGKRAGSLAQAYVQSQAEMRRVLRLLLNAYTE
jgi:trehalose 6-phosphate phosphatase